MRVPMAPCALLMASAATGGSPTESRTGTEIKPPPAAIASTKPATRPTSARTSNSKGVRINPDSPARGTGEEPTRAYSQLRGDAGRHPADDRHQRLELGAAHRRPVSLARDVKLRLALQDDAILEHAQRIGGKRGARRGDVDDQVGGAGGGRCFGGAGALDDAIFDHAVIGEMAPG